MYKVGDVLELELKELKRAGAYKKLKIDDEPIVISKRNSEDILSDEPIDSISIRVVNDSDGNFFYHQIMDVIGNNKRDELKVSHGDNYKVKCEVVDIKQITFKDTIELKLKDLTSRFIYLEPTEKYHNLPTDLDERWKKYPLIQLKGGDRYDYPALEKSIKKEGLKEPLRINENLLNGKHHSYELANGHHRWIVLHQLYGENHVVKCTVSRIRHIEEDASKNIDALLQSTTYQNLTKEERDQLLTPEITTVRRNVLSTDTCRVSTDPDKIYLIPLNWISPHHLYEEVVETQPSETWYDTPWDVLASARKRLGKNQLYKDELKKHPITPETGDFNKLDKSIREEGLLRPLTLMDVSGIGSEKPYKLLLGHHRWLVLCKIYGKDHPVKCRIWYTQKKIPTMDAIKGPIKSMDKVKAQYDKWIKWRKDEHQRLHNQVSSTKVNQTKKDKFNFNPNKLGL
jgi:hypothetical protein